MKIETLHGTCLIGLTILVLITLFTLFMPDGWHYSHVGKIYECEFGTFRARHDGDTMTYNVHLQYSSENGIKDVLINYKNNDEPILTYVSNAIRYHYCEITGWKDMYEYRWWASSILWCIITIIAMSIMSGIEKLFWFFHKDYNTIPPIEMVNADKKRDAAMSIREVGNIQPDDPVDELKKTVPMLLEGNWDGMGASPVRQEVIDNAIAFIELVRDECGLYPGVDDVYASTYGTIIIDYEKVCGTMSIEIGLTELGFYTDLKSGYNYGSEGIKCDFKSIPPYVRKVLGNIKKVIDANK